MNDLVLKAAEWVADYIISSPNTATAGEFLGRQTASLVILMNKKTFIETFISYVSVDPNKNEIHRDSASVLRAFKALNIKSDYVPFFKITLSDKIIANGLQVYP